MMTVSAELLVMLLASLPIGVSKGLGSASSSVSTSSRRSGGASNTSPPSTSDSRSLRTPTSLVSVEKSTKPVNLSLPWDPWNVLSDLPLSSLLLWS